VIWQRDARKSATIVALAGNEVGRKAFPIGLLPIFVLLPLHCNEAFAQTCSNPPTAHYGPAMARAYEEWCEHECRGVFSMSGGNPSCTPGLSQEPNIDKEMAEKRALERLDENLRDLEAQKTNREQAAREQAVDRLNKTLAQEQAVDRLERSLAQEQAISRLGGASINAALVVPGICAAAPGDTLTAACDMVDAAEFGWKLTDAKGNIRSLDSVTRLLAEAAGPHVVAAMVFPSHANLQYKIKTVRSIYDDQAEFFRDMQDRIQNTMIERPATEAARRAAAIAMSENYVALTRAAAADAHRLGVDTEEYIRNDPRIDRVRIRCETACERLIHIFRIGSGFD